MAEKRDELIYEPRSRNGLASGIVGLLGLLIGLGGGLFYTWYVMPVIERDTAPYQLRDEYKEQYVEAIALDYADRDEGEAGNLARAIMFLEIVEPDQDAFQTAAEVACVLNQKYDVRNQTDRYVLRSLMDLVEAPRGINVDFNCDLIRWQETYIIPTATPEILPTPTPTRTIEPTKTSVPTIPPTVAPTRTLTPVPEDNTYRVYFQRQLNCNPLNSGVMEIVVENQSGIEQIPGVPVEVTWNTIEGAERARFFTGLKPEKGEGYADFIMEPDRNYVVRLPDLSESSAQLSTRVCDDEGTLLSYQIIFRER